MIEVNEYKILESGEGMLSERGLQIIEKLIDNNRTPVTSKMLAVYLGVSERSVKTYMNEVSDFCKEWGMKLERKTGIGFVADFTEEQIARFNSLKQNQNVMISQKQRMSYIVYILLSGWDNYTLSLFSEELNVSKKMISDDVHLISKEIRKYNIHINRVAGYGIVIKGDEFSIRKAMRSYCEFPIGNKKINKIYDNRLSIEDEELWVNNWGQDNVEKAIEIIQFIEEKYKGVYTDYSFKMLVQYLSIQLFRIKMGNVITEEIIEENRLISNPDVINDVEEMLLKKAQVQINLYEKQYLDVLFASAALQTDNGLHAIILREITENNQKICEEMMKYLSEIIDINLLDNELLMKTLIDFLPSSIIRTKYGIEVRNPFLKDIREMYSGIFAICFTLGKFYEQYSGKIPTDHEISFLALFIGGALHRNEKIIRAVLIGMGGIAATSIVARKIENQIENVKIAKILSSEEMIDWGDDKFDIVLSMMPNVENDDRIVHISPIISKVDEKKIRDKCFEVLSHPEMKMNGFSNMIDVNHIIFIKEKSSKEMVLKYACDILYRNGFVKKEFFESVMKRENVEPTELGNGVAIPHGLPEDVCAPKVMVIKLGYPVDWGNKKVDIIFLLALNFNNVDTTKAFFHDFAKILESKNNLEKIRKAETVLEIEKILKEKLHWNE